MARASGLTILTKLGKLAGLVVLAGVLAAGLLVPYIGGAGLAAKAGADKFLNTTCSLTEEPVQQKTSIYASDGKTLIATLFDQNRQVVPLSRVPKQLVNALISTEDRRFYQHHGVDLRGLVRAALHTSSGNTQGGSTLTEQYVKQVNYYNAISNNDTKAADAAINQNIDRKLSDAQCALQIEKKYTKAQILEKYLNIAFFGQGAYGIQTAAQTYFGVDVSKLTVPESALLVGLVQSPTAYNPFNDQAAARARRNVVLDNMASQNYITAAQAVAYKAAPIPLSTKSTPSRGCAFANPAVLNAGFFCDYLTNWLTTTGGMTASKLNTGGLKIVSTLNVGLQNTGQQNIWTQSGLDPAASNGYILAMPSVTPSTGAVTSMITDLHYGVKAGNAGYSVNPVFTDAYAGSGSTYKYFTALTALKAGVDPNFLLNAPDPYHPTNCPSEPAGGFRNAGSYQPTLPLFKALPESSNTYFVAMEDKFFGCDLNPIVQTAEGLGLKALTNPRYDISGRTIAQQVTQDRSATFTLGQFPTSTLELTGAFSALANDGVFCPPTPIASITGPDGKPVSYTKAGCTRQFSPYVARTLSNIMVNDTHSGYGTAGSFFGNWYANGGSLVAAKTGTNNSASCDANGNNCADDGGNSALWFVGITPSLTSAAALVNPAKPSLRIDNVPGVTQGYSGDTFGATAAKFWLLAYSPTLQTQQWNWLTPDTTPGQPVPSVTNLDIATAQAQLAAAGFKSTVLPYQCASAVPQGNVGYFSPAIATPGDTINLCPSSGVPAFTAPVFKPSPSPKPSTGAPAPGTSTPGGGNGNGNPSPKPAPTGGH